MLTRVFNLLLFLATPQCLQYSGYSEPNNNNLWRGLHAAVAGSSHDRAQLHALGRNDEFLPSRLFGGLLHLPSHGGGFHLPGME